MSRSCWTCHNLWGFLLTINFQYKYFHNSVDWFCISLHDCQKFQDYIVLRLLENAFVKLPHPRHDLIINPPCRTGPKKKKKNKTLPHLPWKAFIKRSFHEKHLYKGPSMFLGETLCSCSTGKSCRGICSLNIRKEMRTKTY